MTDIFLVEKAVRYAIDKLRQTREINMWEVYEKFQVSSDITRKYFSMTLKYEYPALYDNVEAREDIWLVDEAFDTYQEEENLNTYFYKGKPYEFLFEGKFKLKSLIDMGLIEPLVSVTEWIDVVVYKSLYDNPGKIWVREKYEFYKLFQCST